MPTTKSTTSTDPRSAEAGQLPYLARRCYIALSEAVDATLASQGLTAAQFTVLRAIHRTRGTHGPTSAGLARAVDVTPQAMVGLIAALHARDYVTRAPGTGRAIHVTVTPAGRTAYATAQRKVRALERTLSRDLPDGDYQRVTTLMRQLAETIDRLPIRARQALRSVPDRSLRTSEEFSM